MGNDKRDTAKKLLILSTYFPPETEIAAARLKNICRQLLRLGWEICCVTRTDPAYDYAADEVLGRITLLSAGYSAAVRAASPETSPKRRILDTGIRLISRTPLKKTAKGLVHAAKSARWARRAYELSLQAVRERDIHVVLATAPGIETAYVGAKLKKEFKDVRLVYEYRDIISDNRIYRDIQSRFENASIRRMETAALPAADRVIFLTERIRQAYQKYAPRNTAVQDGTVLTNGYDRESYPSGVTYAGKGEKLVISHVGHLYGNRRATNLAAALGRLGREEPELARLLRLWLIGKIDIAQREEIERFYRENQLSVISFSEPVPHRQALEIMMRSDVNLILTHSSGSEYAIPGKLFEYIGAGRPILAITSDPLLSELIREEKLGWVCPDEPGAIADCLKDICRRWQEDGLRPIQAAERFELSNIVKKLDAVLAGD